MRVFHRLAFQGMVSGSVPQDDFSDRTLISPAGNVDIVSVGGYATQVAGTLPTLSIYLLGSYKRLGDYITLATMVNAVSLSTSQETLFQGVSADPGAAGSFKLPYQWLFLVLGGTAPRGFVRAWITGRDRSR